MKNKSTEEAIILIIEDALIALRTFNLLHKITNVMDPIKENEEFEGEAPYMGPDIAYILMGVNKEEELCSTMTQIFNEKCYSDEKIDGIAQKIYVEWLVETTNYLANKKSKVISLND